MPSILTLKLAGLGVLAAAIFFVGVHIGGLGPKADLASYKTAIANQHATQLAAVVSVLEKNAADAQAESTRKQKVLDDYAANQIKPDAAAAGLASRVYDAAHSAASACGNPVSGGAALAGGAATAAAQPSGDRVAERIRAELERRSQDVIDACHADAEQMNAMVEYAKR